MRGFIGQLEEGNILPHTHHTYIYTHYDFFFQYNDNKVIILVFMINENWKIDHENLFKKIIFANVSTNARAPSKLDDVTSAVELTFTYSVTWEKTE